LFRIYITLYILTICIIVILVSIYILRLLKRLVITTAKCENIMVSNDKVRVPFYILFIYLLLHHDNYVIVDKKKPLDK
jgi:hypothetical protein